MHTLLKNMGGIWVGGACRRPRLHRVGTLLSPNVIDELNIKGVVGPLTKHSSSHEATYSKALRLSVQRNDLQHFVVNFNKNFSRQRLISSMFPFQSNELSQKELLFECA